MKNDLQTIWDFALRVKEQVTGSIKRLTVSISDDQDFTNDDNTMWNVHIGDGTGSFSVTEAKELDETVIRRVASEILSIDLSDAASVQGELNKIDSAISDIAAKQQSLIEESARFQALRDKIDAATKTGDEVLGV
jgi:hypothetical protein